MLTFRVLLGDVSPPGGSTDGVLKSWWLLRVPNTPPSTAPKVTIMAPAMMNPIAFIESPASFFGFASPWLTLVSFSDLWCSGT